MLFVACSYTSMEATLLSCHFSWVWSRMPKGLWNDLWKGLSDFVDFLHAVTCILLDIHWSYKNMLLWVAIARSRLSTNQILKCFKQEKLENYMRCHVDFLLLLELQKNHAFWGYDPKKLLADLFTGFFTFELFDLLILIPGIHCCIVLVFFCLFTNEAVLYFY